MNFSQFKTGRVFVVPLLGGGYSFGVLTFYNRAIGALGNIIDFVGDDPDPPPEIHEKPVTIHDVWCHTEFFLKPSANAGEPWKFTKILVSSPLRPRNRYYRMGSFPGDYMRRDILGEEPSIPLSPEEALKYPRLSVPFPPFNAAQIEVAVKRLDVTPDEFIKSWRSNREEVASKERRPLITEGPGVIHIEIAYRGKGLPSRNLIARRHALEDRLTAAGAGHITEAGGGMGVMDIYLDTEDVRRSLLLVKEVVESSRFGKSARIETLPRTRD
jgi:hypothetical protein